MPVLDTATTPYYGGGQVSNPANVIQTSGAPSSANKQPIGTIAVDNGNAVAYINVSLSGGTANWQQIGASITIPVTVPNGGTGVATLAAHGVLVGEGTSHVNVTAAGTTGQVLTATTSADPAFSAIGTGSGLTQYGVLYGGGTGAFAAVAAPPGGGYFPYYTATGAAPVLGQLVASNGIVLELLSGATNGIDISVDLDGFAVGLDASTPVAITDQECRIPNHGATKVVYTLPTTFISVGSTVRVVGMSSGGWQINCSANQTIYWNGSASTTSTGSISSAAAHDSVTLTTVDSGGLNWVAVGYSGSLVLA